MNEPTTNKAMTNKTAMEPYEPETQQERLNILNARRQGAVLDDENIIAKPLNIPGNQIKLKNPAMIPYWANCVVGKGRRVNQLKLAGFKVCGAADVADAGGCELTDGHFKNDDLLLMMAPRDLYLGALKHNTHAAQARLSRGSILQQGQTELRKQVNSATDESGHAVPNELKSKIQAFIPGEKDQLEVGRDPKEVILSEQG